MKHILIYTVLLVSVVHGATWDQLPMVHRSGLRGNDKTRVEENFSILHPWKPGEALPNDFKEAGLNSPVALVACDLYLDGGSRYYLFRGANDKFLVVCTDSGFHHNSKTKTMTTVDRPKLYLGVFHFTKSPRTEVPAGSTTERFLLEAIKAESLRLAPKKD